jgi:hypothetical protein
MHKTEEHDVCAVFPPEAFSSERYQKGAHGILVNFTA